MQKQDTYTYKGPWLFLIFLYKTHDKFVLALWGRTHSLGPCGLSSSPIPNRLFIHVGQ
jgi:hypothetical protein